MNTRAARPQVSIVLPFFDSKGYLAEAIESILSQEGNVSWELLLVNDGSDPLDLEIARDYQRREPNKIRLYAHRDNNRRGISASRNLALSHARAELIAFLDADDTWLEHKLSTQIRILRGQPRAAMVYGPGLRWWTWMGGQDVSVPALVDGFGSNCLVPGRALLATFLRDETMTPCIGSVMIRRAVLEKVGGFEEQFWGLYDDQVLYAKICREQQVFVSSDCVSRYRQHGWSCCGQAQVLGTDGPERERFLTWLAGYSAESESANRDCSRFALTGLTEA